MNWLAGTTFPTIIKAQSNDGLSSNCYADATALSCPRDPHPLTTRHRSSTVHGRQLGGTAQDAP
jgi:hypothetical protein